MSQVEWGRIAAIFGVLGLCTGAYYANKQGYFDAKDTGPSAVPEVAALPADVAAPVVPASTVAKLPLPSTTPVNVPGPQIRFQIMAWNSQMGLNLSNGGPITTQGSLMEKAGVNLKIIREDDVMKQQTQLIAFCKELKNNPQPTEGAHFMAVMGDGSAATIAGMEAELKKFGCTPEVTGSTGYSLGEDKLMGPPDWIVTDPVTGVKKLAASKLRGSLIATYLRDGDWNIVMKIAADNDIPVNSDERTYDPDAINFYAADDFIKAGNAYIQGMCEDRPVVKTGKRTGETKHICVNAVSSWTPVDVNIAKAKGGLIKIISTREYSKQMPQTTISIREWDEANRATVENMWDAIYTAGDQIKSYPDALRRAAEASAAVYKEEDAAYWMKYFNIQVETDKQGLQVELGGSGVNNLQDAMLLYGLLPGTPNFFAATYTSFGNVVKKQYPSLVPSFPSVENVLNTSYILNLSKRASNQNVGKATVATYKPTEEIKQVVSKKAWSINFATGQSTFAPDAFAQLNELKEGLLIGDDLVLGVYGHTDNTGDPARNKALSLARANAVKTWLIEQSASTFPESRFARPVGYGQDQPRAANDTEAGRAKNRRVDVVLGFN